jgi:hypothetical protein
VKNWSESNIQLRRPFSVKELRGRDCEAITHRGLHSFDEFGDTQTNPSREIEDVGEGCRRKGVGKRAGSPASVWRIFACRPRAWGFAGRDEF